MFKKIISFIFFVFICLLVATVIMSAISTAKSESVDFMYRDGISFEDSQEDILNKEEKGFNKYSSEEILSPYMTLSSIPKSMITYYFQNEKLNQIFITYSLNKNKESDLQELEENYKLIEKGLDSKYGITYSNQINRLDLNSNWLFDPRTINNYTYYCVSQRFVKYDKYIVVIEHALFKVNESNKLRHLLLYSYVPTKESIYDAIAKDL